jgi:hypothetical protein
MLPYLLPLPPLWSPCLLLITDVERTDSPQLMGIKFEVDHNLFHTEDSNIPSMMKK